MRRIFAPRSAYAYPTFFARRFAAAAASSVTSSEPHAVPISSTSAPPPPRQQKRVVSSRGGASWWEAVFSSWQKGVAASLGACMFIGGLAFVLWTPFKDDTLHNSSDLAQRTLGDVKVKEQALLLSKDVVANILSDDRSVELLVTVITRLLKQEDSKLAVTSFIRGVFEDHYTQEITKKFVLKIILDPWIQEQLDRIAFDLTVNLLKDPKTKKALVDLLVASAADALAEPKLHSSTAAAVRSTMYHTVNPWAAPS